MDWLKPDIPEEDPAIARQRELEAARAEADRIKATQEQLATETGLQGQDNTQQLLGTFLRRRGSLRALFGGR